MYTLYKFHFLNGISEINQLFDDILIIWPAPVFSCLKTNLHCVWKMKHDIIKETCFFLNEIIGFCFVIVQYKNQNKLKYDLQHT